MKYNKIEFGYSLCSGKKIYDKKGAQTILNYRQKNIKKGELRIYQCEECGIGI